MSAKPVSVPVIEVNGLTVPVQVRVNRRAKRLILKVDPYIPAILLTSPTKRLIREGLAFARERVSWIAEQLSEAPDHKPFMAGVNIPVRGIDHLILHRPDQKRSLQASCDPAVIAVNGDIRHLPRRIEDWLRGQAREEFGALADTFCAQLGVQRKRITIRDTKSRWGSCSSDGAISFSWRLIMAPQSVYRYVVAHETSHLRHMDHSARFWATVDTLIDDRTAAQDWLSQFGNSLYAFGGASLVTEAAAA